MTVLDIATRDYFTEAIDGRPRTGQFAVDATYCLFFSKEDDGRLVEVTLPTNGSGIYHGTYEIVSGENGVADARFVKASWIYPSTPYFPRQLGPDPLFDWAGCK